MDRDCGLMLQQLDAFLEGSLDQAEGARLLDHLEGCDSCTKAFGSLNATLAMGAAAKSAESWTAGVLERTTGSTCESARKLLGGQLDGEIGDIDKSLLEAHLAHCPGCGELRVLLREMEQLLPEMAEMDPGEAFTGAVLASSRPVPPRPGRLDRWIARAAVWIRRPQFDWEASYVGSLVLFLLLGTTPIAGSVRLPLEHPETLRIEWSALIEEASHRVPEGLRSDAAGLLEQGDRFYTTVRETAEAAPGTIHHHLRKTMDALDAAVSAARETISTQWRKLTG